MTEALWTIDELVAATGGRLLGAWRGGAAGLTLDSRAIQPDDLFIALKGDSRDGHDFINAALTAGAAGALASAPPKDLPPDAPLLLVDDVSCGLESLARAARARAKTMTAIGITGSAGKTSTKNALGFVLSKQGPTHAAEKSFNNHWGVPLTLARTPAAARWGVYEIGMNHPGEILPLTRLVRPDIAIVTTIEAAHLAHFASRGAIAEAKAEIFDGLTPGGAAILNRDNPWFGLLAARARATGARIVGFGSDAKAEARLVSCVVRPDRTVIEAEIFGQKALYRIGAPGRHHAMNSLAVLAAAHLAGADMGRAAVDLALWRPGEGRGALARIAMGADGVDGSFLLMDESYNANPGSTAAALEVLGAMEIGPRGRRIAFLGDMLELGAQGPALHAGLVEAAARGADAVFTAGPLMKSLHEALPHEKRGGWFADSKALAAEARRLVRPGDAAMVKGSNGSRMAAVVEALRALGAAGPAWADAPEAQGE